MVKRYIPDRGDIVWINLNPTRGSEQKGKRPAIVVSPRSYNSISGLALLCPITSQIKKYPFEVNVKAKDTSGVVLTDQIRSVDWRERKIKYVGNIDPDIMLNIYEKINELIR